MKFARYVQDRFEKLDPQIQELLMNDFEPIRCVDVSNDSKIHYFKRENGKLFYLQTSAYEGRTWTRSNGKKVHRGASESIYTRSDVDTYGWTNASDEDGLLDHGHGCQLLFHMEKVQTVGDRVRVYRNQALRTGRVIATNFDTRESLIKYTMPRGAVYMNVISWTGEEAEYEDGYKYYRDWKTGQIESHTVRYQVTPQTYKAVSEKSLSKRWRNLIAFGVFDLSMKVEGEVQNA